MYISCTCTYVTCEGVIIYTCFSLALIGEFESFTHHDLIVSDEDEPVVVSGCLFVFLI